MKSNSDEGEMEWKRERERDQGTRLAPRHEKHTKRERLRGRENI